MRTTIVCLFAAFLAMYPRHGYAQVESCPGDLNHDGQVTVDEIVVAVNSALNDCPIPGPRFVDNGDGTVTDTQAGLMWEKKSWDGGAHDLTHTFTLSTDSEGNNDGTLFTLFLEPLNTAPCFAGHCDWRLPTSNELQGILDLETYDPATDGVFNHACASGCGVKTCSCTNLDVYWSSTPMARQSEGHFVWTVEFADGYVRGFEKIVDLNARAVRTVP